jgi:coenzyme F420-reducing hydrogenase delta subunit
MRPQAIYNLDKPWGLKELTEGMHDMLAEAGTRREDMRHAFANLEATRRSDSPREKLRHFRIGEERVRKIVLGAPEAATLASTPPAWARWRSAVFSCP